MSRMKDSADMLEMEEDLRGMRERAQRLFKAPSVNNGPENTRNYWLFVRVDIERLQLRLAQAQKLAKRIGKKIEKGDAP